MNSITISTFFIDDAKAGTQLTQLTDTQPTLFMPQEEELLVSHLKVGISF